SMHLNDLSPAAIYTLSLHDALPIYENFSGPEWTSGSAVGSMDLVEVTEYSYKANAEGLEPNTTYYYQVGSEAGETSEVGTFTTADRKSTRLNSSHVSISYAVFCLKK